MWVKPQPHHPKIYTSFINLNQLLLAKRSKNMLAVMTVLSICLLLYSQLTSFSSSGMVKSRRHLSDAALNCLLSSSVYKEGNRVWKARVIADYFMVYQSCHLILLMLHFSIWISFRKRVSRPLHTTQLRSLKTMWPVLQADTAHYTSILLSPANGAFSLYFLP